MPADALPALRLLGVERSRVCEVTGRDGIVVIPGPPEQPDFFLTPAVAARLRADALRPAEWLRIVSRRGQEAFDLDSPYRCDALPWRPAWRRCLYAPLRRRIRPRTLELVLDWCVAFSCEHPELDLVGMARAYQPEQIARRLAWIADECILSAVADDHVNECFARLVRSDPAGLSNARFAKCIREQSQELGGLIHLCATCLRGAERTSAWVRILDRARQESAGSLALAVAAASPNLDPPEVDGILGILASKAEDERIAQSVAIILCESLPATDRLMRLAAGGVLAPLLDRIDRGRTEQWMYLAQAVLSATPTWERLLAAAGSLDVHLAGAAVGTLFASADDWLPSAGGRPPFAPTDALEALLDEARATMPPTRWTPEADRLARAIAHEFGV